MLHLPRFGWLMLCALGGSGNFFVMNDCYVRAEEPTSGAGSPAAYRQTAPVDMFAAIDDKTIEVNFIPRNSREAMLIVKNKSDRPVSVKLPETFVGVPVLAQMQGQNNPFGNFQFGNNGQQSSQSSPQGLGSGNQANRGNQNFFNIPPEKVVKIRVDCVCLDYGHPEPSPRMPYQIAKTSSYVQRPAVVEVLKSLGSPGVDQQVVQAAAWHLNNDLTWQKLATRWSGELRLGGPSPPMFSQGQMKAARSMAEEARRAVGEPVEALPPKTSRSAG